MGSDAADALARELGAAPPDGVLAALEASELRDLARAIRDERAGQSRALAKAGEKALGGLPRLLRGPVKRVVGA